MQEQEHQVKASSQQHKKNQSSNNHCLLVSNQKLYLGYSSLPLACILKCDRNVLCESESCLKVSLSVQSDRKKTIFSLLI